MAGVNVQVDVSGLEALQRRLARFTNPDARKLLKVVGAEVESQTRARFETETGPDGRRWQALTAATILRKLGGARKVYKKRGGMKVRALRALPGLRILQESGALVQSIQFRVHGDEVEVGTNIPYAAIHQFGGAEIGRPGIPARPYLGISAQNEKDLAAVVQDYFHWLAV